MTLIRIYPDKVTKISEEPCTIYSASVSQLITLLDANNNVIDTTYANKGKSISANTAIFAKSHNKSIEISVHPVDVYDTVNNLVIGKESEINAIEPKKPTTMYVVIE